MDRRTASVTAAGFCTFINLYAPQSLLPTLATAFGASLAQAGLAITTTLIAVALVAPFAGTVSDAFGRRRLIVGASFLLVVPTALAAAAPSLDVLLWCRFLQGLTLPFIFTVTIAYIADECPGVEAVRGTAMYSAGTIVGGFFGRFIAGWTAEFLSWRASFLALAALTAVGAVSILTLMPREQRFRPVVGWRGTLAGFVGHLRNWQVVATCLVGFTVLFSIIAAYTYANFLLAAAPYHLGPAQLGTIFVTYLLGALTAPVTARLIVAWGRKWTVLMAGAVAVAGMLLTLVPSLPAILIGLSLLATAIFTEQTVSIGYVAVAGERSRSTAVGLYVTCYYAGGSLGGIAPAGIWSHLGWPGCVALVIVVQAVALAVVWTVWPGRATIRSA